MGEVIGKMFVDVTQLPNDVDGLVQVLFLGAVYGYILFNASNMISEGSELLLLTSAKDLVGSVILPILGAVPDGAIILFSGSTQSQLAVGVGALAGSTIMLLTIPWALAIIAGRVNIVNGQAKGGKPKLDEGSLFGQLFTSGACSHSSIGRAGFFMLLTMVSYFVIQIPSFKFGCSVENCGCAPGDTACLTAIAEKESIWALMGLGISIVLFLYYLYDQLMGGSGAADEERLTRIREEVAQKAIERGLVNLNGIFGRVSHLSTSDEAKELHTILLRYFNHYDTDRSGDIDSEELAFLIRDLRGEPLLLKMIQESDTNQDGRICFKEFEQGVMRYLEGVSAGTPAITSPQRKSGGFPQKAKDVEGEDGEESEEEDMPEDIAVMDPADQQKAIWKRAIYMMSIGTAMVLVFSDPMVGVLDSTGTRLGINPFYISFILAPLASNASELLAAYAYALKKTEKTFTISLSALLGAACMNNTFCLAIFLYQIYSKSLLWEFTAETTAIVVIEIIMFAFSQQVTHTTWQAIPIALLFPISIVIVAGLESIGLD
eukprot:TRINITY_DN20790_c0_g1_i1.p1 TRINITY_DN20790_c0_g1~~TRINITY_DN20790_c0_g1_i1.p1  ORF type:complete len:572 (+),score=116.47 TRINITY_DN20790_c0_g1_i1:79-1716(+)